MSSNFDKAFSEAGARKEAEEMDLARGRELHRRLKDVADSIIEEYQRDLGPKVVKILRELKIPPAGRACLEGDTPRKEVYREWWNFSVTSWGRYPNDDSPNGELVQIYILADGTFNVHQPRKIASYGKFYQLYPLDGSVEGGYPSMYGYRLSGPSRIFANFERRKLFVGSGTQLFQEDDSMATLELGEYMAKYIQYRMIQ